MSKKKPAPMPPDTIRAAGKLSPALWLEGALERTPRLFIITEGVRTLERQRELFLAKKSKTMRSKHLPGSDGLALIMDKQLDLITEHINN